MEIRVWEYLEEYAEERNEILAAVDKVFSSGTLVLGESVKNFEKDLEYLLCYALQCVVDVAL